MAEPLAPYAHAAAAYLAAGWCSPVPLGQQGEVGAKYPVPKGFTGRAAAVPSAEQVAKWSANGYGANNIGLHLAAELGVVGIDVDAYGDKHGDEVLAKLEAELGALPPTVVSTSRPLPSGIRLYRLPAGVTELKVTKVKGGIEVIQAKHRYVAAWPSLHPETGARYEWVVETTGAVLGRPPKLASVPELPEQWVGYLCSGAASPAGSAQVPGGGTGAYVELSTDAARLWLAEHGTGRACRAVRGVLRKELAALEAAAADGTSRYDTAVEGSWALVSLAAEGHLGVKDAVNEFGRAYREAVRGEENRDPSEWARMVTMGVAKAATALSEQQGEDEWAGEPHAEGQCPEREEGLWPPPSAPLEVARRYVATCWSGEAGAVLLRRWRGEFYTWRGSHWRPIEEEALRAQLGALLADAEFVGAAAAATRLRWNPTPQKLTAVLGMLASVEGVLRDSRAEPDARDGAEVVLANGVLDVAARELRSHDPARFVLAALPFEWVPGARCPRWRGFLRELWPEEAACRQLLAQWFGYAVSGQTGQHKALLMIGPPRSGKSTIARVLTALLGREQVSSPTLTQMGTDFGLASLIGTTMAVVTDAEAGARAAAGALDHLKAIIGEDDREIARKYLPVWKGRLGVRFTIIANQAPAFLDPSGSLAARLLPLPLYESFEGREDVGLTAALLAELPGVLVWALAGLDSLAAHDAFVAPEAGAELRVSLRESFSPVRQFVLDACEQGEDEDGVVREVERGELYVAYQNWCRTAGRTPVSDSTFGVDLRSMLPRVMGAGTQVRRGGRRVRLYYGLGLREDYGREEL